MVEKQEAKKREKEEKEFDFYDFEFKTIEDFDVYNKHVRNHNRTAPLNRQLKIKVPDESFHKKVKVKFQRFDQPENVLKAYVRTKDIEWKGQLKPGCSYNLPVPVVKYLNSLAEPIFKEVKVVDEVGDTLTETKQVGEKSRFSCQLIDVL